MIAGNGFGPPLTYLYFFTEALIPLAGGRVWVCCCKMLGFVFSSVVPALKGICLIAPAGNGSFHHILCRNAHFWNMAFV